MGFMIILGFVGWKLLVYMVAPNMQQFISQKKPESTFVLDRQGNRLYEYYTEYKREEVTLDEISPHLINATLSVEDKSFYQHHGLWIPGIVRAALLDAYYGDTLHGGSTITQQLVKNVILINDKSIRRKVAEVVWAVELEKQLSKEEILTKYLNLVPYGRNSAGAEAGSLNFFGKKAIDLTPAESAYLASLPKSPTTLSPDGTGRQALEKRQKYILELMKEESYLSSLEYQQAKTENVKFIRYSDAITAPHFVFFALKQTKEILGGDKFEQGGLVIHTTLDSAMQATAEITVQEFLDKNDKRLNAYNAGLLSLNPKTGEILSYVGSRNYFGQSLPEKCKSGKTCLFDPKQDIIKSPRQTGSSFKPYVYVTAFGEKFKMTPASRVSDIPTSYKASGGNTYRPSNYSGASYGWIPARKALAGSLNISAVNLLAKIGTSAVTDTVRKLGITADFSKCGLSMALGACEMTLLEHTGGFAGLVNLGAFNKPTSIKNITTTKDAQLYSMQIQPTQAVEEPASFELLDILSDNSARTYIFGAKSPLAFLDRPVAVKTGTTQNWKDAWTVGGTPQVVTGLWVGNNSGAVLRAGSDSIVSAAPLWREYMDKILVNLPIENFREPFGISRVVLDPKTGKAIKPKVGSKAKTEPIADYALNIEVPKIPKPKVASAITRPNFLKNKSNETTTILEPWPNQVITTSPFDVKVYVGSSSRDTTVTLKLDGQIVGEKFEAPFLFTIPNTLANGWHTLEAISTHFDIFESKHSIKIRTMFNPPPYSPRGGEETK